MPRNPAIKVTGLVAVLLLLVLAPRASWAAADEAMEWDREIAGTGVSYVPVVSSAATVVAPSELLPGELELQDSNNNCGIFAFAGRLYFGWRTSRSHFASGKAVMHVASRPLDDDGARWTAEASFALGADVREPNFHVAEGQLVFSFFEAGVNPFAFEPKNLWRTTRLAAGQWTPLAVWGRPEEVLWDIAFHDEVGLLTSYHGNHYSVTDFPDVKVHLNVSSDGGATWTPLAPRGADNGTEWVYQGGVSEVGFTVDIDGNFWGVTRNEDGDSAGFGSFVVFAPSGDWGTWQLFPSPNRTMPDIYESPKLLRHGDEIYLIARTDPDGPYDRGYHDLTFNQQRAINLATYSLRKHGTGLWRINQQTKELEFITTLPGCGDTAFPSITRVGKHRYIVANYTNPTDLCADWTWLRGQVSLDGTYVYFIEIAFNPA